ncbi:hypothetical protein [Delftia sp. JD2]|uniref:hypothetical protein n=1 Tax=Delftia sp. JD2 TaxID=469553 RepID=UPI000806D476|nr:hypothetical protein [Delftia sp. JD2]OBY87036.1 hypothetical protein ACM14_02585 [Delftia sp. JD2]
MEGLDFSGLTDDQLIELARGCCVEALARSPSVTNAMLDMMRDESAKARDLAEIARNRDLALILQAAELVGHAPDEISISHVYSRGSRRVYINMGRYRFSRHHIVDYNTATAEISTVAALRDVRPQLIEFCAGLTAVVPLDTFITT